MHNPTQKLIQELIQGAHVTQEELNNASTRAKLVKSSLPAYLLEQNLVPNLAELIAKSFDLPFIDLQTIDCKNLPTTLIDAEIMRKHNVLPLRQQEKQLKLAITDPTNQTVLKEIRFHTGLNPECVVADIKQLKKILSQVLHIKELQKLGDLTIEENAQSYSYTTNNKEIEDAPIVQYVQKLLNEAMRKKASDIHLEPYEQFYRIRFRIDGVLYENTTAAIHLANRITARIKIMAQLDISERRLPQDGRFKLTTPNESLTDKNQETNIDFRVSTCPTIHGEKIVLRILNQQVPLEIEALGLTTQEQNLFYNAIKKPQGLILVTGPTGSGKTTTLYSALKHLNSPSVNILSAEDPVEIFVSGINQVNIQPKIGVGFATLLKTFLRQDPDIIMVGEIRDQETAEIAIRAAQTGHLVLSTLHTNSAAETVFRLYNMGINHYNLITSITLIIAQRLVRKLCSHCKQTHSCTPKNKFPDNLTTIYLPVGCEHCTNGYAGRIGIFEILSMQEAHTKRWLQDPTKNMNLLNIHSLYKAGLEKVKQGLTSLDELNRVANH